NRFTRDVLFAQQTRPPHRTHLTGLQRTYFTLVKRRSRNDQNAAGPVLARGMSRLGGVCRERGVRPSITSISKDAAILPCWVTSRPTAVSAGRMTWQIRESSQATIDSRSGTGTPISCAAPNAATAIKSLSKTSALGGFSAESNSRVISAARDST